MMNVINNRKNDERKQQQGYKEVNDLNKLW